MKRYALLFMVVIAFAIKAQDWQSFMVENQLPSIQLNEESAGTSTGIPAGEKNPKLAFVLSAIVPGSGQFYSKSYIKSGVFLAIEVTSWSLYFKHQNDGKDIEKEFQSYANTHWSESEYWRWIANQAGLEYDEENIENLREWEQQAFSHGLHREKDQQYYEMIGKYHQFSWGWDDFREDNTIDITDAEITRQYNESGKINDNRYFYEQRRNAGNDAFKKATTASTIALLNHLLSAIDAVWTTSRYNQRVQTSFRFEPKIYDREPLTVLTLRVDW